MYIKAKNGVIEQYPYSYNQLLADNPEVSFPSEPTDQLLAEWDVYPVVLTPQPSCNPNTEYSVESTPIQKDGIWIQTWVIEQLSDEECKQNNKATASQLLYETDWTTIPDVIDPANDPYLINQEDFISYRNIIRKIAVSPTSDAVFPEQPVSTWSS
jgi:hypothetical protein